MRNIWRNSVIPSLATALILSVGVKFIWLIGITIIEYQFGVQKKMCMAAPDMAVFLSMFSRLLPLTALLADWPDKIGFVQYCELYFMAYRYVFLFLGTVLVPLACVCYFHHRRFNRTAAIVWGLFVTVVGVPGAIGYWLHRRWPPTEHCLRCGRQAPCDRESCCYCGEAFPPPPNSGIELRFSPEAVI